MLCSLYKGIKHWLKPITKRAGLKSPYNQAMANLLQSMPCNMDTLTFSIDYDAIQFTKGNLLEPQPVNVIADDPLSVTITWTNNATGTCGSK